MALPSCVLPSATISGESTEFGNVLPIFCVPPYGHSANGIGGEDCGVGGQAASGRLPAGACGSAGATPLPHSSS